MADGLMVVVCDHLAEMKGIRYWGMGITGGGCTQPCCGFDAELLGDSDDTDWPPVEPSWIMFDAVSGSVSSAVVTCP
ncbi:hypothetical protein M514_12088 [Trichuris suis]|uniref:Uncharacterized protein n=1 Tax=Trichuris suis TaxID=68888 RepID=A0A085LPZ9_9BILA|nr:hypothetical protein M513_12088 [Trichuris suis]KFD67513.1 hypothetical protein M514_12088 [Trichuris suis]